jgi:hypothetical protein
MGWMVNGTPRPLYPKERHPVPNCIGAWVVPTAGLDGCGKRRPYRDSIPDRPARSESPYYAIPAHTAYFRTSINPNNKTIQMCYLTYLKSIYTAMLSPFPQHLLPSSQERILSTSRLTPYPVI